MCGHLDINVCIRYTCSTLTLDDKIGEREREERGGGRGNTVYISCVAIRPPSNRPQQLSRRATGSKGVYVGFKEGTGELVTFTDAAVWGGGRVY